LPSVVSAGRLSLVGVPSLIYGQDLHIVKYPTQPYCPCVASQQSACVSIAPHPIISPIFPKNLESWQKRAVFKASEKNIPFEAL